MNELDKIILQYRSEFDSELPVSGDFERFVSKMDRRRGWNYRFAASLAASVLLLLSIGAGVWYFSPRNAIVRIYEDYYREVAKLSTEMQMMVSYDEINAINGVLEDIDYESVPFISMLPDEMNERDRLKAVKEYYGQKMEGIKRFKVLITESKIKE